MTVIERHDELLAQMYLQMHPDLNPDVVRKIVKKISYDNMIDTPCVLHNDITNETIETSLTRTMEWVEQREPIITGNGTFVKQHGELKAPTVKMLESLQRKRDVKKKEMFACDEGSIKYKIKKTAQLNVKKIMNAEYGGSGTPLSPFYSQYIPPATTASAKALTTTLICCLEMASGNTTERMQISISQLYDFIHIILTDEEERIHRVHNAGVSPKQCCDYLIAKVFHPSQQDYDYLLEYLKTLPQDDVCKLYYAFNIKGVLQYEISNKVEYVMEHIKRNLIDIENFNKQDVQNMGYGDGYPEAIKTEMSDIVDIVLDSCVYPYMMDDNEARCDSMKRCIVCVTDTDSLMVHFASYFDQLFVDDLPYWRDKALCASAFGKMLFVDNIIPKFVKYQAKGCGIKDPYYASKFIFKNEFLFLAMTLYSKKMYAQSTLIQEGKPLNPHKIGFTGLSFKKRDSAQFLSDIMVELYDKYILTTNQIRPEKIYESYQEQRRMLQRELLRDPSLLKGGSVKPIESYTKTPPAYVTGAVIWNAMHPDDLIKDLDRVKTVPLSWKKMHENENDPMVRKLLDTLHVPDPNEKKTPYCSLPEQYKVMPDYLAKSLDLDFTIDKILSPYKQIGGLFDFVFPETQGAETMSRLIYF